MQYSMDSVTFRASDNKGFTLIDTLVGILLMGIVSAIVAVVVSTAFKVVNEVQARKEIVLDGSAGAKKFAREYSHLSDSTSLLIADTKKIRFSNSKNKTLEYELTTGTFFRTIVGQTAQRLTGSVDVGSSSFKYYEKNNTELTAVPLNATDRAKVWMVEFALILNNGNESVRFTDQVFPENLKL